MLIQKKSYRARKYWLLLCLSPSFGCVSPDGLIKTGSKPGPTIDDQKEATHRLGLVGQDPAYLLQQPVDNG